MRRPLLSLLVTVVIAVAFVPLAVVADDEEEEQDANATEYADYLNSVDIEPDERVIEIPSDGYRLGTLYNTDGNSYSDFDSIDSDDYHYNWEVGNFYVRGYQRVLDADNGDKIFLKTARETLKLYFVLDVDIDDCTPDGRSISISDDDNGYDENFCVGEVGFGRGTVIIRFTDYLNNPHTPVVYTNFFPSCEYGLANIVDLCQEGDYEVTLDYELKVKYKNRIGQTKYHYPNYKITFNFSVRNGNTMVYIRDLDSGEEIGNENIAPNGFVLDLAGAKYLHIQCRRMVFNEGANGLVADTRFNEPVRDGSTINREGIYEITVTNPYTPDVEPTKKTIYVGSDQVMMSFVSLGFSIEEINDYLSQGYSMDPDGHLISPTPFGGEISNSTITNDDKGESYNNTNTRLIIIVALVVVVATATTCTVISVRKIKKAARNSKTKE